MIKDIKELNFPDYATLSQATCTLQDMAEKTITTQVKIDGEVTPDFSHDWEIEFKGEKYIMPLRQPQAAKENTSLNSTIDLTFQHWAQYQLKRWYFFTVQAVESGTAVADKYIASVSLNLKDFCDLFSQVLKHYFDDAITIDLNKKWEIAEEPQTIEISYSYLWDVLIQFYDLWAVRWQIEPKDGNPDKYVIKVGYPVAEVDHIFEYGFKGGLLKVERQVQDDNIRNMLLGRGGGKNIPYRYFKDIDPNTPSFPADPDWIPELSNIYFSELRGKTFRDYVKGWKTNSHRQLTDATGNPIAPYVLKVIKDENSEQKVPAISSKSYRVYSRSNDNTTLRSKSTIKVPTGYVGNLNLGDVIADIYLDGGPVWHSSFVIGSGSEDELNNPVGVSIKEIRLIDSNSGGSYPAKNILVGTYYIDVVFDISNGSDYDADVSFRYENAILYLSGESGQQYIPDLDNPISIEPYDEKYAATSWAYKRGHEDEKFDPTEYVKDDTSIVKYGELMGALENNEEIYPSIQGVTVDPYGRIDEIVDIEKIESDDFEEKIESDTVISNIPDGVISITTKTVPAMGSETITFPKVFFSIPEGKHGNLDVIDNVNITDVRGIGTFQKDTLSLYALIETKSLQVYEKSTGEERSAAGIPEGEYYYILTVKVNNIDLNRALNITVSSEKPRLMTETPHEQTWGNTFDIWIKNIWGTSKKSGETDAQYAERVWLPILGDRDGEEAKVVFSTGDLSTSEDYEFIIKKGGINYDTGKSLNGVPSHWRLTLGKSDADLESTGLYLPSTMRNGKAGDHFFFIGIDMPHQYVVWAEERLDNYKTENLDKVKDIKPTWVVSLDKVRINNKQQGELQPLISQLRVGDSIRLADKRFIANEEGSAAAYEILYLQSITYTYNEPSSSSPALVPDVEIVLSDKYETIANPVATLSGEVSTLAKQVAGISNVEQIVRAIGDKLYLRKDGIADRSMSPTEFFSLVNGRNFRSGIVGGASWGIYQDANGNWVVEADRFKARQDFEVNNLVINQISARGGMIIESAAQMEVTHVEETADGYVCYFDQKMGSVANLFHVDDVAYCNRFTPENAELKFYKRRVIAVSVESITLKKYPVHLPDGTNEDVNGSGIPEVGDVIVQYGNYTDPDRRYAKIYDVIGGGYERYLEGLDSVNASGKEYYFVGKHDEPNPRWFIGYRDGNYAEWRDGNLYIKGNIDMTADSSLQNVDEFKNLEGKVDNLKIGGRNLLLDTQEFSDKWGGSNGIKQEEKYLGLTVFYGSNGNIRVTPSGKNDPRLLYNQDYTLSIYAKGTGVLYAVMFIAGCKITATNGATECIGTSTGEFPLSSEWKRFFITFHLSGGVHDTVPALIMLRAINNGAAYICGAKLEYGNVPTDWSPAPEDIEEAATSDLKFIKQIFPTGLINNTATVSQLLAVKDSTAADAQVVAGIYGGGVEDLEDNYGFRDKEHGKLMIFAGASNINNVASAATRIYEDGTIITSKLIANNADITGKIVATSGQFGSLRLDKRGLYTERFLDASDDPISGSGLITPSETYTSFIQEGFIRVIGKTSPTEKFPDTESHESNVVIGEGGWGSEYGACNGINISCIGDNEYTKTCIGIRIAASGAYTNHALHIDKGNIYIEQGKIRGFRLYTVRVTYSQRLLKSDSIILVQATSAITLTLPADPEDGQLYFIKSISTSAINVTLTVGATGHYINDGRANKKTSWTWNGGPIIIVVWDATNKTWQGGHTNTN